MNRVPLSLPCTFGVLLIATALAIGVGGHALAQQAATNAENSDTSTQLASSGWTLSCKPDPRTKALFCEASQTIVVAKSRDTLLVVFVTPVPQDAAKSGYMLRFQLPHGLDLSAGIRFRIDEGAEQAPVIQTSNQSGLFARAALTDPLLTAMKKGATMAINVNALNGNALSIPVTLNGFSAIYAKLQ